MESIGVNCIEELGFNRLVGDKRGYGHDGDLMLSQPSDPLYISEWSSLKCNSVCTSNYSSLTETYRPQSES